jgi:hypothetical protein
LRLTTCRGRSSAHILTTSRARSTAGSANAACPSPWLRAAIPTSSASAGTSGRPSANSHTSTWTPPKRPSSASGEPCASPAGIKQTIQDGLRIELDTKNDRAQPEIRRARERVEQLSQERRRLARGVVSGSIPDDLAREEQERIQRDLDQAKRILETSEMVYEHIQGTLERALELLERVDEVYRLGSPRIRQMLNQCFFSRVLLDGEQDGPQVTGSTLREPWTTLLARDFQARMRHHTRNPDHDLLGRGSIMKTLVPPAGFEPATPALGDRSKVLVTAFDLRKPGPAVTATDPVCRWLIARLLPVDHGGRTLVVEGPCSGEKAAADGFGVHRK